MFPHRFIGVGNGTGTVSVFREDGRQEEEERARRRRGGTGGGEDWVRLSEEDRAKGIILIAPDFLSSPLCDPGARFLVFPLPLLLLSFPSSVRPLPPPHLSPRAGSSKSFLRLIFPSNLHAAVIKGLGRGTSSGASTDAAGRVREG